MRILNPQILASVASIALGSLAVPGLAVADQLYGSGGILTNRVCPPEATNCTGTKNFNQYAGGMGVGFSTSADIPGGASAAAAVSFGEGYLPTVKVASASGAQTRTGGSAVAFRTFTYEGDASIDLALNGQIHYVTSGDPLEGENAGDGLFYASLSLLPLSALSGFNAATNAATIVGAQFGQCGSGAIAFGEVFSAGTSGDTTTILGLSQKCGGGAITLTEGDRFLLVATLQAISNRGGWVDAMNTFRVEYDVEKTVYTGTSELVGLAALQSNVNGAVPEPGTWALMIMGFCGAGAMLRRQRRATAVA